MTQHNQKKSKQTRVRFAPSPTGYLHLGSARTALYNFLFARNTKGVFILRIEDTDQVRSKQEYLDEILEDLKWLGLDWDQGPYYQTKRKQIYADFADKLLKKGQAYKDEGALRFRMNKELVRVNDLIRGQVDFDASLLEDLVIIKSNGLPAYNFACVVDDIQMNITHVIRGDDHLSNTPKQAAMYQALGYPVPVFAHIPLILGQDRSPLSKRHNATAIKMYREQGFLP
ncbi:MAG: glutamate--tRNA ligase, partial [Candidatus Omnitrophica bacterium]|nr:glutamate--tRNA ligase [Candidatus Omnitrophota bacterium]